MGQFERHDHELRISNLRTLLQMADKPAERTRLSRAIEDELAQCERLGCTKPLLAEEGKR